MKNPTDPEAREILGLPSLPRRGRGRPKSVIPGTIDEALKLLSAPEQSFVRAIISGKSQAAAYSEAFPNAGVGTATVNGSKMAARAGVAHAIALSKQAGALETITGIRRDLAWADNMLAKKIAKAEKLEQMTAVSSLTQQWLKLHGLLIERQQIEQSSLIVNISGVDTSRLTGRVIEHGEGGNE